MKAVAGARETEEHFQDRVVRLARKHGWRTMHVRRARGATGWSTPTTCEGWPDLVLWRPGRFLIVELKADRGRLTPIQTAVITSLRRAGVECHVWHPSDWVIASALLRAEA